MTYYHSSAKQDILAASTSKTPSTSLKYRNNRVISPHLLGNNDVFLNKEKCVFGQTEIEFLGHRLSDKGVQPSESKISAIKQFREPTSTEEVHSFLGLVNYVGKFKPKLADLKEPLRNLLKNGVPFDWTIKHSDPFLRIKRAMSDTTKLGYCNTHDQTQVIADASPIALGAVLVQLDEQRTPSKSLSDTEKRYCQTEKEALALVWAVEKFHIYLYGKTFDLVTDHKPLEAIFKPTSRPCARIERWVLRLQSYSFVVKYVQGKKIIADPLSRLCLPDPNNKCTEVDNKTYVRSLIEYATPVALTIEEIERESIDDLEIKAVKKGIYENIWDGSVTVLKLFETEFCFHGHILLRSSRIVMPQTLRDRTLENAHEGHPGATVMKRRLRAKVWWPGMDKMTETFVKGCRDCTLVSAPTRPELMSRKLFPAGPWEDIAIDFKGKLPNGETILVVVDYYSRFVEAEFMRETSAKETIVRLVKIFSRLGVPKSIRADNGPQFTSKEFATFCRDYMVSCLNIRRHIGHRPTVKWNAKTVPLRSVSRLLTEPEIFMKN